MPILSLPISSLLVLAAVIPGYVTYRTSCFFGKRPATGDRFDKTIITIATGIVCIGLVLIPFIVISDFSFQNLRLNVLNPIVVFVLYSLTIIVGVILGILSGIFIDNYLNANRERNREDVWNLAFDQVDKEGTPVKIVVVTQDGDEIRGEILATSENSDNFEYDVLIRYPERSKYTCENINTESFGEYVYLTSRAVSYISLESK